jgi:hypothetical protein
MFFKKLVVVAFILAIIPFVSSNSIADEFANVVQDGFPAQGIWVGFYVKTAPNQVDNTWSETDVFGDAETLLISFENGNWTSVMESTQTPLVPLNDWDQWLPSHVDALWTID